MGNPNGQRQQSFSRVRERIHLNRSTACRALFFLLILIAESQTGKQVTGFQHSTAARRQFPLHKRPVLYADSVSSSSSSSSSPSSSWPQNNKQVAPVNGKSFIVNGEAQSSPETDNGQSNDESSTTDALALGEVNVLYGRTSSLVYDPVQERYVNAAVNIHHEHDTNNTSVARSFLNKNNNWLSRFLQHSLIPRLAVAFFPSGVTPNYYRFTQWRIIQRFISANLHVIGTQSLLLGLGIQATKSQLGALSAALNWVLKDALGKLVRMFWASRMGRRFDSDAKRWRFRSSLVYAAGNGLEIVTYLHPALFLIWATLANCCKQISMLTSSSTRTAIYNSFRDGSRENIGDITAKGEAQIAVVDLLGIASGVTLSKAVGMSSMRSVVASYLALQVLEIVCMYRQLRTVEYRVLNFERLVQVIRQFCQTKNDVVAIPTPQEMARHERIFLPPQHLSRRAIAYGSLGRAKLSPTELERLMEICAKERFLLVVGANVKYPQQSSWTRSLKQQVFAWRRRRKRDRQSQRAARLQENCHIVLHAQATNLDIVKSTLALILLRQKLAATDDDSLDPETIRSSDCFDLIAESLEEANACFPSLLRQLSQQGWESPARFMFGRVHMRATWPLSSPNKRATSKDVLR